MTAEAMSREPATPVRPDPGFSPDAPPPPPPRELEPHAGICIPFEFEGEPWIARAAGKGAGGTGSYGLAMMEAVHFCRASAPVTPLFEALVAAGALAGLFPDELCVLLRRARRVVTLEEVSPPDIKPGRHLRDG
jgi:hypothetical protein